ncbi:lactococcin 972 family bacteriocin [Ornithinimicrobium kibberense]|uniref:Lactococcin 972 family bacteriocin n=1 Tax=Ornithinimicrobium kibberense TaxID=282060 RepID=A0ABV5V5X9_9MICO
MAATAKVGGGDWHYGTYLVWNGKACYSNYMHYGVSHGSTAIIASARDSDWQAAGRWSEAVAVAGVVYDCSTYWRT